MPVELFDMVNAFSGREYQKEKEEWRRIRWLAAQIINISQKYVKYPLRPEQLIQFKDEIIIIDPEERKRQALESLEFHKKKFWVLLKTDEKGRVRLFGEEEYKKLMEKEVKR